MLTERDRIDRLSRVRDRVFGSLDGLIVPLGVVSGVAGGIGDSRPIRNCAGIAEAFAGALSMGAGEFIAGRCEAQVQQTEVRKELAENDIRVIVGGVSAGGGYVLGTLLPQLFGY